MRRWIGHLGIVGAWLMGFVLATSVWADGGHAGRVTLPAGGGGALGDRALPGAVVPTVWAHQPYVMHMAVTNRTAAMRKVTKVTTSCACLTAKAVDGGGRGATALPGGHVETWIVRTDDDEIPVLTFPVSATVSGALKVAPAALMVDEDEGLCARIVTLRPERKSSMVHVLGAETMPRKWGDVVVEKRPLNGWMIRITGIDPRELAQFSKRPYLQVRTDCLEMENFEIPIRVMRKGNGK